jgi:hypothetical protein
MRIRAHLMASVRVEGVAADYAYTATSMPVALQLSGDQTISHGLLQLLQWAGWAKVLASSHSCLSLLHWAVAWEMMSSEWHLAQTGVVRVEDDAPRSAFCGGSCRA